MEIWNEGKIKDFVDVKGGKRLPKGKKLAGFPTAHPYIRIRDIDKSKVLQLTADYEYVDDETQKEISRYIVSKGDILISVVGTIGLVGIVGDTLDGANQTENCDKLTNFRNIDRDFLYYYLVSHLGQGEIAKGTVGAVQPKLPLKNIQDFTVRFPSLQTQEKIASVLTALDDKIEKNTEVNENLLQQAQAIYCDMFITNTSPSWQLGHLADLITVRYGKDHKKLADGAYPVYGSGGIMRYVERPLYDKESVLIPRKGTLNNVMYVNEPFWSVDTMFFTEMKMPNVAKFVFHFAKSKDLASLNSGSAVPSMTTDILNAMELSIPDADTFAKFEGIVAPMYQTIQQNTQESNKLSELRDSLLPRLMSGELDVSDIDF